MTNACAISCLISNRYIGRLGSTRSSLSRLLSKTSHCTCKNFWSLETFSSALVKLDEHTGVECMGCRDPKHITQESYILGIPSPDSTTASYSRVRAVVQNILGARVRFLPPLAVLKGKGIEE